MKGMEHQSLSNTSNTSKVIEKSKVQEINLPLLKEKEVRLLIKREDLLHPHISGNKWRKLKGNLEEVKTSTYQGIVTFGGAFSNHIHAISAACHEAKIPCVGIIRGEYDEHNPTIQFAHKHGMKFHFISRSEYRFKDESKVVQEILSSLENYLIVPEGGSNRLALLGLKELADEISLLEKVDMITVSAGTGMTAAGIILYQEASVTVFSSLKSDYLKNEIKEICIDRPFHFNNEYHFGGYGKTPTELILFINKFHKETNIPLDPIYNGKAIYGILDQIKNNVFPKGTTILHIHTGGLQGIVAYNYIASKNGKILLDL